MKNSNISVVDSSTWKKLTDKTSPFMLIVHKGENIIETILDCMNALDLPSASISGLGALENPSIAYFNLQTKQYQDKIFSGVYELISLNGNIARAEDASYIAHIHVTLGNEQYQVVGGHLKQGIVGVTAEITFIPFKGPMTRKLDAATGAKLITL
jgi:predicted DNA-binding protein with PD1-like motif